MVEAASFAALVERAAGGDQAAAAELIRTYETELRRFVRFRLTNTSMRRFLDSLDVCQSVLAAFFVQLQDGKLDLTDPGQLMRLLRVMAKNKLRDKYRRDRAERRGGERLAGAERESPEVLPARDASVSTRMADLQIVEAVRHHLPEPDRVLLERWMGGDDWDKIASELGGSAEALRKRLSRAIDRAAPRSNRARRSSASRSTSAYRARDCRLRSGP